MDAQEGGWAFFLSRAKRARRIAICASSRRIFRCKCSAAALGVGPGPLLRLIPAEACVSGDDLAFDTLANAMERPRGGALSLSAASADLV